MQTRMRRVAALIGLTLAVFVIAVPVQAQSPGAKPTADHKHPVFPTVQR